MSSLSFWQALSFWTMLIAAIAGVIAATSALISRHAASIASEIIQRESNEKIVAANERIAKSEQKAREAEERIALAEQKVRESDERIAVAQKDAAEANLRAAEAREKAEEEQVKRLRLEEKLAPRSLSQTQSWIEKLRPFAGTSIILRVILDNNQDGESFADHLASVLQSSGWVVHKQRVLAGERISGIEVHVSSKSDDKVLAAVHVLIKELVADGIFARQEAPPLPLTPNMINMSIGPKP